MLKKYLLVLLLFVNLAFSQKKLALIPKPTTIETYEGHFILNENTVILGKTSSFETQFLKEIIKEKTGLELKIATSTNSNSIIQLSLPKLTKTEKENYSFSINKYGVFIESNSYQAQFYAIQTLSQIIPFEKNAEIKLPFLNINDQPKYAWRGMHLDCARHFFSVEFVKKYIDYLAMYKFNTFHWHLTDDQGWRIEIKKYPKLTEVGAWRKGSMIGHYNDQKFDDKRYGGFYTQQEIKEIVAYATERHITVVPEIEMPGHAVAALAAYPEYSCTSGPFEVGKIWGVLDDVFCPKDETFTFLENILTEVIDLFPSEYIHIGGDECPKTRWKVCPHCQKRMKDEKLKDEHELQSYFIQRIEKFVNANGRKIIGWDEILEGGLAPNAAVMSWRGTEGGIAAAKQKHFVVMSPGSHCYFDHYQGEPKNEPLAIGGYTTVEKVYSFQPTPKELTSEETKYILGAQANVWTEYIATPNHVEYMIFPRMLALSEVLWGTSNPEKFSDFQNRLIQHFDILETKGINYSKSIFEVTTKIKPSETGTGVLFELQSANNSDKIRYTTNGSLPTSSSKPYTKPIEILKSQTVKAAYFDDNKPKSAVIEQTFSFHKATGKKIILEHPPHENYSIGGALTLVDGVKANRSKLGKDWLGFSGKDLIATIDLGKKESIKKISISTLASEGSWIHYPKSIEILTSNDGITFQTYTQIATETILLAKGELELKINNISTQFIKIIARNAGKIPEGKAGAGSNAWLFVDEIGIE
ncbi:glycoside hydrolase family 20 protein [Flavobacterium difficile]|uniref:beta-N-acetylhexosaminidase n=1 Tax=Flavobacterium difficile TaxID=2709659 RepID=A0ABX0I5E0_9FLAO|nr:family 20 glycosylhydrolase [Flavobacterium difficile]NHM00691.1 family 20 glycosylhydrolase [Flavobacterium difficile]